MHKTLKMALSAGVILALGIGHAQAQSVPANMANVLGNCPINNSASNCPPAVSKFASDYQRGPGRDAQLTALVVKLAEAARRPNLNVQVCRDIADGIRTAARNTVNGPQRDQMLGIADSLCAEQVQTSAINRPTPKSISDMTNDYSPPDEVTPPPPPPSNDNCDKPGRGDHKWKKHHDKDKKKFHKKRRGGDDWNNNREDPKKKFHKKRGGGDDWKDNNREDNNKKKFHKKRGEQEVHKVIKKVEKKHKGVFLFPGFNHDA